MTSANGRNFPWEGTSLCQGISAGTRQPCGNFEIEGMGYCMHHVPLDMVDEAEEVTGIRLCRRGKESDGGVCRNFAVDGTEPPTCNSHGATPNSQIGRAAAAAVNEEQVTAHLERILMIGGEQLLNPPAILDPLTELLMLASEIKVFKQMLTERVSVMNIADWRFTSKSMGEQTRAEIQIYERALDRLANILIQISKLGIEARLARIEERQLQMLERAMTSALESTGLDLMGIDRARKVLRRELYVIEGHVIKGEDAA